MRKGKELIQKPTGFFDFEGLSRCPLCEAATVSRVARWKLYLGATERCSSCMGAWRFVWGKWLYHLPVFAVFLLELALFQLLGITVDPFIVLAAIALPVVLVPIFLPLKARLGERLTDRAIRRLERGSDADTDPDEA